MQNYKAVYNNCKINIVPRNKFNFKIIVSFSCYFGVYYMHWNAFTWSIVGIICFCMDHSQQDFWLQAFFLLFKCVTTGPKEPFVQWTTDSGWHNQKMGHQWYLCHIVVTNQMKRKDNCLKSAWQRLERGYDGRLEVPQTSFNTFKRPCH